MKLLIVAGVILAGFFFSVDHASAAPAQDGYVTNAEFNALESGYTMSQLERTLGVVGRGHVVKSHGHGADVTKQYPFCGKVAGFVQVYYERQLDGAYVAIAAFLWRFDRDELEHQPAERIC